MNLNPPSRTHLMTLTDERQQWQDRLPELKGECQRRWGLEIGDAIVHRAPSAVFNVRARGRAAVLKLAVPGAHLTQQAAILRAAAGQGYVHLYDADLELGALLLEHLGPSLQEQGEALYDSLLPTGALTFLQDSKLSQPVIDTLRQVWALPHELAELPDDSTYKAASLRDLIDGLRTHPQVRPEHAEAIDRARLYAEQRLSAREAALMVMCHGDPHPGNLLQVLSPRPGAPTGYVWVDPDGFLCEAEYDLGVVLRGFNRLVLAADDPVITLRAWCAALAEATGTDGEAVWQWSFIERVTTGLYLIDQGRPRQGLPFLDSAAWLIARRRA